ncbi:hypothetical protein SAMN05192589_102417 [Paracidovorax valerianellae]|uniref:Uncharacterized protein n=1 Tax=Paracidovorax valerianellae TaxID=187868 RepID=A0A1G6MI97_9BURK|nr:hypothetical protein SAMN05192589_102417 [Paracidovorax valerianellae]
MKIKRKARGRGRGSAAVRMQPACPRMAESHNQRWRAGRKRRPCRFGLRGAVPRGGHRRQRALRAQPRRCADRRQRRRQAQRAFQAMVQRWRRIIRRADAGNHPTCFAACGAHLLHALWMNQRRGDRHTERRHEPRQDQACQEAGVAQCVHVRRIIAACFSAPFAGLAQSLGNAQCAMGFLQTDGAFSDAMAFSAHAALCVFGSPPCPVTGGTL